MHPSILDEWTEVLDTEATGAPDPPLKDEHEHDVCFAGRCYPNHDTAVFAVQHDAPLTVARFQPCEHDLLD